MHIIVLSFHRYDKTPAQIVLRWHLAHNRIIIPKSQTPKRIKENFDIFDFNLELTDVAEIDSLNKMLDKEKILMMSVLEI